MDKLENLKEYVEFIKNTDIEELDIETKDGQVYHFKRSEGLCFEIPKILSNTQTEQKTVSDISVEQKPKKEIVVKSPMVGKFLTSTSKDHPPIVMEGSNVKQGQRLALIEAMRILKDVLSPATGVIKKVLVADGQFVEYGQGLFVLEQEETI